MTSIRRLGAIVVPVAAGVVAFGPGAAAQAAGTGITSPGGNAVITSGSTTTVRAHINLLASGYLYVRGPGTSDRKLGGGLGPKDVSGSVNISRNGAYVATLKDLLGGTIDQRTFYVRVPPARPSGVDASVSERKLVVRWDRGHEPDLTGYDVYVGGARQRQGSPGALCAGDVCSTALSLPGSGGRVEVGVRARRSNGTGGTVASGLSTTSVTLPLGAALSGRGGVPARLPSASASANPLLPLPGRSPLSLPTVAPDGQTPGFQYPTPGPQVANPATAPKADTASSSPMRWGKSVALALILLIVAAHLGAWTRRLRLAQAAQPGAGGALSPARRKKTALTETERARAPAAKPRPAADDDAETPGTPDRAVPAPRTAIAGSGRLIDAKGTVANAQLLGMNGSRRSASESADDASPASAVPATAGAGAPSGKTRAQHSGGSRARRSGGYRGRRRAD